KILRAQGELKQKIRNQNKQLNDYLSSIEKIIKNKAGNSKDVSHINQLKKFEPKDFTQLQDKKQSICEWMFDTM